MHELSIATAIVEQAGELARADSADTVSAVTVRVGELAGVVPDALHFAFEVAREGTPLATAELVVEQVTAHAYCAPCAEEFALGMPPFFWCPRCETPSQELRSGRELEITQVVPAPGENTQVTPAPDENPQSAPTPDENPQSEPAPGPR